MGIKNKRGKSMFNYFFKLRYIVLIIVFSTFLGSALMMSIGLIETFEVFNMYLFGAEIPEEFAEISRAEISGLMMVGVLDSLLFGLVLIIFSYGVYVLYIHDPAVDGELPEWLRVKDVEHLKKTLAQVIVVILFVKFLEITLEMIVRKGGVFEWEHLVLPMSIFLLSLGLKVLFEE
jgi:uncharacterized membrane protein YqhA